MSRVLIASLLAFVASLNVALAAETIPPKPERYFNDYAGVISPGAALRFNEQLARFERETSNQFVVAVFPTFPSDSSIEDFTQRVFQSWKVWQAGKNNGVVLFVFVREHKMRIQTGYGLEGALPDITCSEIVRNEIAPRFRRNDYEGGLAAGINAIIPATKGEYKGSGRTTAEGHANKSGGTVGLLVFLFIVLMIMIALRASRRRGGYRYTGLGGPFVMGNWGGGGSGWSGGSSGGGGGFSSFMGGGGSSGGSGGGGASGSW